MIWYSKIADALPQWSQVWTPNDCFTCIVSMQQYGIPGAVNYGHVNKMLRISIDWNVLGRLRWSMFMYDWYPLISIYIYIIIYILYTYHEEPAGLCSTMGCLHVSTDFCAKSIAVQGLSMSPSWYIISSHTSNYLEGIWSHHNITIISRWIFGY